MISLLIFFLIIDGLASLVAALIIYTNRVSMGNDLNALKATMEARRLENLDKAVVYFNSRILQLTKARDKASLLVMQTDVHIPEFHDYAQRLAIADAEIKLLRDVISYLKLC